MTIDVRKANTRPCSRMRRRAISRPSAWLPLRAANWDSLRRTASFLWNHLHSSESIQKYFRFYSQWAVAHPLIRLTGSLESYINKFSPKARNNRLREIKRLRALGDMQLIRVTKASEIDTAFLDAAHAISQRTWQFLRYRWGIGARDFDQVRSEMHFLAQRGWLRGYLLKCRNAPCSFIIGQQYGQTLYTAAAGVHPAWRSYSAGTVLLLLVLEDLFKEDSVQFYDLGD
jgi:Acetyltransferase (GNAT) domain